MAFPLGKWLMPANPVRQGVTAYLHMAGIETGYGYFAPNIPTTYKLVFEVHYPDGHVERELPTVSGAAAGLRVAGLLDEIGRTEYEPLRQLMIKMLAHSIWREHPKATMIRAVFGIASLPTVPEFEQGKRQEYEFLYSYDFTLKDDGVKGAKP